MSRAGHLAALNELALHDRTAAWAHGEIYRLEDENAASHAALVRSDVTLQRLAAEKADLLAAAEWTLALMRGGKTAVSSWDDAREALAAAVAKAKGETL